MIRVLEEHGCLHTHAGDIVDNIYQQFYREDRLCILVYRYPEGDCDTISWPNPNEDHLRSCLFDARETGMIPGDTRKVLLPDGSEFSID
jgi:hypothetical protein